MYLLYDFIIACSVLLLLPVAFVKGLPTGRGVKSFCERLGIYDRASMAQLRGRRIIWVHAVSVGEVNAAAPLMAELKKRYPDCALVLSCVTLTGRQIAEELASVDLPIFFPVDLAVFVRRALKHIRPHAILLMETELWPNFILGAAAEGVPLAMVNGRISKRSFGRFRRLRRYVTPLLQSFSSICAQDAICARRFKDLGAIPDRVSVSGNVKYDALSLSVQDTDINGLGALLPLNEYLWVAGSTHTGENEMLLDAHQRLLEKGVPSFLVLAPRHLERCDSVAELLKKLNISFVRRSQLDSSVINPEQTQVLLLDTMGELTRVYASADVVFVGGSLIPEGGHNLLEPAQLGKPVLFGPHMFDNLEMSRLMRECGGGRQVADTDELTEALEQLFEDLVQRREMGQAARCQFEKNSGATEITLRELEPLLACCHE